MHEGVSVFVEKWRFKKKKLARSIQIRNVDKTDNNRGMIMYEIEYNLYYKGHVEQVKINIYNLERTEVILGISWLVAHNPEIDWKKREIKMMRYSPLCGRNKGIEESRKRKQVRKGEKSDKKVVKKLVPKRFWRWKKVFGKAKSEYMPV